jgi:hypothetical protein
MVYYVTLSVFRTLATNSTMNGDYLIENNLEGSGRGQTGTLSSYVPARTQENHEVS